MASGLNAKVVQRIEVSPGLIILGVAPDGWSLPSFEPGQFAVLGLPGRAVRCNLATVEEADVDPDKLIKRAYSIASSSQEKKYLEFYVSLVPSGPLTPRLFALQPGDPLWLGPKITGLFTLDDVPADQQIVMIATGTGLAPYMSMLRTHSECGDRRIAVLHGARHSWELGYRSELSLLAHRRPTVTYTPIISRQEDEHFPWAGETGHIQDLWNRHPLEKVWGKQPTPRDTHIFLCGNPEMIEDMLTMLSSEGFTEHTKKNPGQIHLERFW